MQTTVNMPAQWVGDSTTGHTNKVSQLSKWEAFEDAQAGNITLWYLVSMIAQGVFFLPVPALLIYYFNAPVGILFITLGMFFANIIAGMSGLGIRTIMSLFAFSIIAHLVMLAIFII